MLHLFCARNTQLTNQVALFFFFFLFIPLGKHLLQEPLVSVYQLRISLRCYICEGEHGTSL